MPKIRDLGIKVIPETMRPPEIGRGGGGGCNAGTYPECGYTIVVLCDTGTTCTGCGDTTLTCCPGSCGGTSQDHGKDSDWKPEAVARLKEYLRERLAQIEEYEKSSGSKKPSKGGKKSSKKK